jgi:hypothetical protein
MRLCVASAAACVSVLVFVFFPGLEAYRGLSGIDTAMFVFLAIDLLCDARRDGNGILLAACSTLLFGFAAKTMYEAVAGSALFVDQKAAGFGVLVWDHIAAGCVGALVAVYNDHRGLRIGRFFPAIGTSTPPCAS